MRMKMVCDDRTLAEVANEFLALKKAQKVRERTLNDYKKYIDKFLEQLEKGCDVSIIEMMDKIAGGESSTILPTILADFAKHHVKQYVNTKVSAIENDGKVVRASENGRELRIDCDMVVMAVGSRKNTFDASEVTVPVCYVGDCSGERTAGIMEAVRSGYKAANEI